MRTKRIMLVLVWLKKLLNSILILCFFLFLFLSQTLPILSYLFAPLSNYNRSGAWIAHDYVMKYVDRPARQFASNSVSLVLCDQTKKESIPGIDSLVVRILYRCAVSFSVTLVQLIWSFTNENDTYQDTVYRHIRLYCSGCVGKHFDRKLMNHASNARFIQRIWKSFKSLFMAAFSCFRFRNRRRFTFFLVVLWFGHINFPGWKYKYLTVSIVIIALNILDRMTINGVTVTITMSFMNFG